MLWLLLLMCGVGACMGYGSGIQEVAYLEFPMDNSGVWKYAGNAESVSGNFQLWISTAFLYQVKVDTLTPSFSLIKAIKIPPELQPKIAMLTTVGPSGGWYQYITVLEGDAFTLKEYRVSISDGSFTLIHSTTIPSLSSYSPPNWQLFVSQNPGNEKDIIYLYSLDVVVSLDYPDWQFVNSVNVSDYVPPITPVKRVYSGAAAILDKELYMPRYGGPQQPGQLVLFDLITLSGRFAFDTVTFLGESPTSFEARVKATPTWIFWTQSGSGNGTAYRWTLKQGNFKHATQTFLPGEAFGPAQVKNQAETQLLYSSGPIDSNGGYRLSQISMQEMEWGEQLMVHNDTLPQLALQEAGGSDGFAVFGTLTLNNTMKLVLYQYSTYY